MVLKILDLEEKFPEFRQEDEIVAQFQTCNIENKESFQELRQDDNEDLITWLQSCELETKNEGLLEETTKLWKQQQCHSCWKFKSNQLGLPCTHLVICENCISDKCIICNENVTHWIKVHT